MSPLCKSFYHETCRGLHLLLKKVRKTDEQGDKQDAAGIMHWPLGLHCHGGAQPFGVLGPSVSFPVQSGAQRT